MRRLAPLMILLLLTACTSVSYDFSDIAAGTPRFGDRDPHKWQTRPPWSYPVHGTDVAKYQGNVDWKKLKREGIAFAYIKATEGGDRVDERFAENWREARAAGMPHGAYHFYYFCRPAIEQARWFIEHVPDDPHALPPALDMEWNPASPSCKLRPDPAAVYADMRIFLNAVEKHYGKRPIIYTTVDFFRDNDLERFRGYPFWVRSVAGHPDDRFAGVPWRFWQYTGTGIVPGIDGDADINTFNGTEKSWHSWLEANAD